jgi:hypothetical protein
VDPGRRFVKVLIVDRGVMAPRIVHFQTITAPAATPEAIEEMDAQVDTLFEAAGPHERVLVLPQYRAIAQVLETPVGAATEAHTSLLREARRLSGLEEGALAFDACALKPFGRWQNPSWLTLCKREELDSLLTRFATLPETAPASAESPLLAEITTGAQALFAAAPILGPEARNAVLVDLRANNSVVAILVNGQGVATSTIPTGSSQFRGTLPDAGSPGMPGAGGVVVGEFGTAEAQAALRIWAAEIRVAVTEWLEDNPECGLSVAAMPVFLSGVGATRPGLVEFLNTLGPLRFVAWEERATSGRAWPMADYLVPYGAALLALQRVPHAVSLLPAEERAPRQQRRRLAALQTVNVLLVLLVLGLLSFATWQKRSLIQRKQAVAERTRSALHNALAIDLTYRQILRDYADVQPILERQRQTIETLQSLAAARAARTNDDFWYVLFADAETYATGRTGIRPVASPTATLPLVTNQPPPPPREYVLEVCVPHDGENQRRLLSDLVAGLKREVLFKRVDALPPERNRDWLPTNVFVSNRVFALAMEIAGNELPPLPPPESRTPAAAPLRAAPRGATANPLLR